MFSSTGQSKFVICMGRGMVFSANHMQKVRVAIGNFGDILYWSLSLCLQYFKCFSKNVAYSTRFYLLNQSITDNNIDTARKLKGTSTNLQYNITLLDK